MLQKAAHDAEDPDIFRLPRHAGQQTADTAYHKVDFYSLLRRPDQPVNDGLVGEGVDFYADEGRLALPGKADLPVDQGQHPVLQTSGCYQQLLGALDDFPLGQGLKYCGSLHSDGRIRRHQGEVGIEPGRFFIVVSGAHLGIVFRLPLGPAGDKAQFAMYLIAIQSIDDLAAGLFQTAGPFYIVFLVKTGFQLHQHQDVFPILRRFDQAFHNLAVPGYPVKGHFNGHHLGVSGCLLQEIQKRLHAFKRIGEQLVPLPDLGHHGAVGAKLGRTLGKALFIEQLRVLPQSVLDLGQEGQIQR